MAVSIVAVSIVREIAEGFIRMGVSLRKSDCGWFVMMGVFVRGPFSGLGFTWCGLGGRIAVRLLGRFRFCLWPLILHR